MKIPLRISSVNVTKSAGNFIFCAVFAVIIIVAFPFTKINLFIDCFLTVRTTIMKSHHHHCIFLLLLFLLLLCFFNLGIFRKICFQQFSYRRNFTKPWILIWQGIVSKFNSNIKLTQTNSLTSVPPEIIRKTTVF